MPNFFLLIIWPITIWVSVFVFKAVYRRFGSRIVAFGFAALETYLVMCILGYLLISWYWARPAPAAEFFEAWRACFMLWLPQ